MDVKLDEVQLQKIIGQLEQEAHLNRKIITNLINQSDYLKSKLKGALSTQEEANEELMSLSLLVDWLVIFFKSEGYSSADMFRFLTHSKSKKELVEEIEAVEEIMKNRFSNIGEEHER